MFGNSRVEHLFIKSSTMVCRKAEKARLGVDSSTDDGSDYKIFEISNLIVKSGIDNSAI